MPAGQGKGRAGERLQHRPSFIKKLSRHKNQSADWYLFHDFLDKVCPALVLVNKQSARRFADTTFQFWEDLRFMTLMDICKAYGEMHDLKTKEVMDLYMDGTISQYELMEGFLQNEGIFGYTQKIISAMQCVYVIK